MKRIYWPVVCILILLFNPCNLYPQVGIGTDLPDGSSILDVSGTSGGILIPRMTSAERKAITSIPIGLIVFQTDAPTGFYYYTGSVWTQLTSTPTGVVDYDGNAYPVVRIGNQEWMAENLRVTHYMNGNSVPNVSDATAWNALSTGAYCWYNNDATNAITYGALYNWYAVADERKLCPAGWHVPSDAEWTALTNYLGGTSVAGGRMKATVLWNSPNSGASNVSRFMGVAGGCRHPSLGFASSGENANWWSSTPWDVSNAMNRYLSMGDGTIYANNYQKTFGMSVRCVKD